MANQADMGSFKIAPTRSRWLFPSVCLLFAFLPLRQPVLGKLDLLLANRIVEVFSLDLPPASHVRLPQNMYDIVVIALEDAQLTVVPAVGDSHEMEMNTGDVRILRSSTVQEFANTTGGRSRFTLVALKSHGIGSEECGCSGEVEKSICGCSGRHLPSLWALSIGGSTLAGTSLRPGQEFAGASYRDDSLLVSVTAVQLRDERSSGPESLVGLQPGEIQWLSRGQRQFKNIGPNTARFITIEF